MRGEEGDGLVAKNRTKIKLGAGGRGPVRIEVFMPQESLLRVPSSPPLEPSPYSRSQAPSLFLPRIQVSRPGQGPVAQRGFHKEGGAIHDPSGTSLAEQTSEVAPIPS